jgi:hypothetical protein
MKQWWGWLPHNAFILCISRKQHADKYRYANWTVAESRSTYHSKHTDKKLYSTYKTPGTVWPLNTHFLSLLFNCYLDTTFFSLYITKFSIQMRNSMKFKISDSCKALVTLCWYESTVSLPNDNDNCIPLKSNFVVSQIKHAGRKRLLYACSLCAKNSQEFWIGNNEQYFQTETFPYPQPPYCSDTDSLQPLGLLWNHFLNCSNYVHFSLWSRVFLVNLTDTLVDKKISAFHGTQRFITIFIQACPRPCVNILSPTKLKEHRWQWFY